jgi:hypothetical protein
MNRWRGAVKYPSQYVIAGEGLSRVRSASIAALDLDVKVLDSNNLVS